MAERIGTRVDVFCAQLVALGHLGQAVPIRFVLDKMLEHLSFASLWDLVDGPIFTK